MSRSCRDESTDEEWASSKALVHGYEQNTGYDNKPAMACDSGVLFRSVVGCVCVVGWILGVGGYLACLCRSGARVREKWGFNSVVWFLFCFVRCSRVSRVIKVRNEGRGEE